MERCLSAKHGGQVQGIKTYCRCYVYRPMRVTERLLCTGYALWEPCPDLLECSLNMPDQTQIYKPAPYWLRKAMEE